MSARVWERALLVLAAGAWSAMAQPSAKPTIVRVASTSEVAVATSQPVNSLIGRQMPKFVDQVDVVREKIEVAWEAPRGSPAGRTEIRLQYRTPDSAEVLTIQDQQGETRPGRHLTTFALPPGVRVSAWRVQLGRGGRVLDEKTSGSWR
jgi:hypothetical protein